MSQYSSHRRYHNRLKAKVDLTPVSVKIIIMIILIVRIVIVIIMIIMIIIMNNYSIVYFDFWKWSKESARKRSDCISNGKM